MSSMDQEDQHRRKHQRRLRATALALPVIALVLLVGPEGAQYLAAAVLAYDLISRIIDAG